MAYDGPILDNHFHLNQKGRGVEAAKDFQRVGGTHLVLVHCPDFHLLRLQKQVIPKHINKRLTWPTMFG